jgi:tetratricopeptide (TPR) repeat protein
MYGPRKPVVVVQNFDLTVSTQPPVAATLYQSALAARRAGRLAEAEAGFRAVLAQDPRHADALHMLGIVLHMQGHSAKAEDLMRRALTLREDAFFLDNLGNLLWEIGRPDEAEVAYRRAIRVQPENINVRFNLGKLLKNMQRGEEAEQVLMHALLGFPAHPEIYHWLGTLLYERKQLDAADSAFRHALAIAPDLSDTLINLGRLHKDRERLEDAATCYRKMLIWQPQSDIGHFNLGVILEDLNRFPEAEKSLRRALAVHPDMLEAHLNLGNRLRDANRTKDAIVHYRRVLELDPASPDGHNNVGIALMEFYQVEPAMASFQRAVDLRPDHVSAHLNINLILRDTGKLEESKAYCQRTLAMFPDNPFPHLSHAYALLQTGDLRRGWQEFEYRWKVPNDEPEFTFTQPIWRGKEDLRGKAILIYSEQGLGDTLQFVRYTALLAERGVTVYLLVPRLLRSLVASCPGVSGVYVIGDALPPFDYRCPMMSVPLACDTQMDSIPANIPYLTPPREKVAYWRERLGPKTKTRVGITWAGDPRKHLPAAHAIDRQRSMRFEQMRPILDVEDIEFYCLQFGGDAHTQMQGHPKLIDYTREIDDFQSSAAFIENLDLVITVDTSVCHLVGAIGKPVWMLNRFNTCWRWLMDREDSPWYPTMRIFRQPALGDWASVVERVKLELDSVVSKAPE